jgi:hypothetical protein
LAVGLSPRSIVLIDDKGFADAMLKKGDASRSPN